MSRLYSRTFVSLSDILYTPLPGIYLDTYSMDNANTTDKCTVCSQWANLLNSVNATSLARRYNSLSKIPLTVDVSSTQPISQLLHATGRDQYDVMMISFINFHLFPVLFYCKYIAASNVFITPIARMSLYLFSSNY